MKISLKMTISALDKETVKLITTSQVVTSISSATKELIENALDANAKNIEINLSDNGCSLIEVKDDGCGISKEDAPYMALSSHTSKIFSFSDLDSLNTYGFRGEALYALSSVSDLKIITKTEQDEAAVGYSIDHSGHVIKSEPSHRATGTTVQVRNLFKNVPVRRQIILNAKKAKQDVKTLESLIQSYGICKHAVRINFRVDNNVTFVKPGTTTLEEAVAYIVGRKVTNNMKWLNVADTEISGKIMIPLKDAQNVLEMYQSGMQFIFVNDRPIKHKEIEKVVAKTINEALGQESSSRKKPIFVLYLSANAESIDVNLEPNKTAILFRDQKKVIEVIQKMLENFYEICREELRQESICNSSVEYQDYSQSIANNDGSETPACKKRKLQGKEQVVAVIQDSVNANETTEGLNSTESNLKCKSQPQNDSNEQSQNESLEKDGNSANAFDILLPPLDLSDSDSQDSQKTVLFQFADDPSSKLIKDNSEERKDSPPFELTPGSETLSQLPLVDLGEDFDLDEYSNVKMKSGQGQRQGACKEVLSVDSNSNGEKSIATKEWSKGHMAGLKGGTDIDPYNHAASTDLSDEDVDKNVCKGFLKFSRSMKLKVVEQNPAMTAPQIAQTITNLWKKLSPEERGYYRDLAQEEKAERDSEKENRKEKHEKDVNKNKNRLLRALQKMKTMNPETEKNLLMRTLIPSDIDLKKVTDCFLNNSACKNNNYVIGRVSNNLWIVHKSAHIWVLDLKRLQMKLCTQDTELNEHNAECIEQLLRQWFSTKDDLSLLHPIHSLLQHTTSS